MSPMTDMPCILDREIKDKKNDAFGHIDFAIALKSIIESPENKPPFSIGLLGLWGTGKSSIKSLYLQDLNDSTNSSGTSRKQKIKTINFNAWKYGNNDGSKSIKKSLLRHVYLELGGDEEEYDDIVNNITKSSYKTERPWRQILKDFFQDFFWNPIFYIFQITTCTAVGYLITFLTSKITQVEIGPGSTLLTLLGTNLIPVISSFTQKRNFGIQRYAENFLFQLPKKTAEDYEATLKKQITKFKSQKANKHCDRIVIFIEDLDRLSPTEMIDGIDAIRTFMEMPNDGLGIIFVISCAENRIAQALNTRQMNNGMPGAVKTIDDARRYLDRIFQFRLEIPPLPKQDMRDYALERLKSDAPKILSEIESKGGIPIEIVDRMIHTDVTTPRKALQIINAFIQAWWIAKQREHRGSGSEAHGGLQQGSITNHPKTLAIISSIKICFPDFYLALLENNNLIQTFTNIFINGLETETPIPEKTSCILNSFWDQNKNLRTEHFQLKRYLSYINGHLWPTSLKPFLELSQDVVSRKYGDRANKIYNELVSGNAEGILEALGKSHQRININKDDVALIAKLFEEADTDTHPRKINAVTAIARISTRTEDTARARLLHPICPNIINSKDTRERIGIKTLSEIVDSINKEYRIEIIEKLTTDAFAYEQFGLRLPSAQTPSFSEAEDIATSLIDTTLKLWDNGELSEKTTTLMAEWMLQREINIGNESKEVPFTKLQQWVSEYPKLLLPIMSAPFIQELINEKIKKSTSEDDLTNELNLCEKALENLYAKGQDSRHDMWKLLCKLVEVQAEDANHFAWSFAEKHLEHSTPENINKFCTSMSTRLLFDFEEREGFELEKWDSAASALIQLIIANQDILNDNEILSALLKQYSTKNDTSKYVVEILNKTNTNRTTTALIDYISSNFGGDMSGLLIEWIAQNYQNSLSKENKTQINTKIIEILNKTSVDESEEYDMSVFFENICHQLSQEMTNSIFETVFNHLYQYFTTNPIQPSYFDKNISKYFKDIIPLYKHVTSTTANSNFLNTINALQNHDTYFYKFHELMKGSWPLKIEKINWQAIAQYCLNFFNGKTPNSNWEHIFNSLHEITINGKQAGQLYLSSSKPRV